MRREYLRGHGQGSKKQRLPDRPFDMGFTGKSESARCDLRRLGHLYAERGQYFAGLVPQDTVFFRNDSAGQNQGIYGMPSPVP